ncbi:MAG TPA: hypothetical protein PKY77_27225 [Phycisphaerae bacterium]|nr:hypothetical protein [Phycisphaerae bacterium]HRY71558.1 hypothetical protein [Phycisphaerae bacterium]HSA25681.1 hypothetical protein [Phycisphaerae bacterium]
MKLSDDLKDVRVTVARAAELVGMHPAHFRRLCRRGVFPPPKRTGRGRPYCDYEVLTEIERVLTTGVGHNGEEVTFYRRSRSLRPNQKKPFVSPDPYLKDLAEGLGQLGIPRREQSQGKLTRCLAEMFKGERPGLAQAIPAIAQRLLAKPS